MIRAAIELPADVLRCMESAAALAGAVAGLAGVTALAAAIPAERLRSTAHEIPPLRPTPWLGISDSNFDVRRENSSL
jgi:hypothetical protein